MTLQVERRSAIAYRTRTPLVGSHGTAFAWSVMAYSERIVMAGSTRDARSAGIQQAAVPIAAISTATAPKVTGSRGATPKSNPRISPVVKNAPRTPTPKPMRSKAPPSRRIIRCTRPPSPAVGSQAHPNADLVGATAHRERQHARDTHRRDDQRENSERRNQLRIESPGCDALGLDLRYREHVFHRRGRCVAPSDAGGRRGQAREVTVGPNHDPTTDRKH